MKKLLLIALGMGSIAYLLLCFSLRLWQNRLIFFPSSAIATTPDLLGLTYEDVWLSVPKPQANTILTKVLPTFKPQSAKVERIHGWWLDNSSDNAPVLLYLHGNGANIGDNLGRVKEFYRLGFSVLVIDYRGYGRSEGRFPTERTVYEDARIAWNYLVRDRKIKPQNIFIYGHSLGGAIAIDLGARQPQAAGLIVESSFTSMRDMIDHQGIYSFFPADLILTHKFNSISKIARLQTPILLIHGSEDLTVPASMSQILFDAATVPKKLLIIPSADHNNVPWIGGKQYWRSVKDFSQTNLNSAARGTQSALPNFCQRLALRAAHSYSKSLSITVAIAALVFA
jgi:hypothetical protein